MKESLIVENINKEDLVTPECESFEYLGDKVLYDLCKEYPDHKNEQEVFAKIWLIGRSYAAALERGKDENKEINDDFYQIVSKKLKQSDLDTIIGRLKNKELREENIKLILGVYQKLHKLTISFGRGQKHSFCSKYLHFHFPNLFFIYDSRVASSISKFKIDLSEFKDLKSTFEYLPYFKFFCQCFILQKRIKDSHGIVVSPRQIDTFLVKKANEILRNKVGK